jgi:uroporphyrinogen-III synthase
VTRILITRPWEDAEPLAARLALAGYQTLIEPMLRIAYQDGPVPALGGLQGVLFTSANGVRAFARLCGAPGLAVFAVGDATAEAARAAGFVTVASAGGDVEALARLVIERCRPEAGPLLHIAASVRAGDLSGHLARAGFRVERHVLYHAEPATTLSDATLAALAGGEVQGVLLFSPRTARAWGGLVNAAGLASACGGVDAVCLSAAVAAAAQDGVVWRSIAVAARPDQDALLALLGA